MGGMVSFFGIQEFFSERPLTGDIGDSRNELPRFVLLDVVPCQVI